MKRVATALAAGALLFSSAAFADEAMFKAADTDGDGMLSAAEVMAAFPSVDEDAVAELDANGDGALDLDEFETGVDEGVLIKA